MKSLTLALMTAGTLLAAPAFADHASDNADSIARLAYRLADTAENLEHATEVDAGGWNERDLGNFGELESAVTPQDHRRDNLMRLYRTSRSLHLSASDLYRAARGRMGPGVTPQDHRGDDIRGVYEQVREDLETVEYVYNNLRGQCSREIDYLVADVLRAYEDLEWAVHARRNF